MIRASDFLRRYYQTLHIGANTPRSNAGNLKSVKTPPRTPVQTNTAR